MSEVCGGVSPISGVSVRLLFGEVSPMSGVCGGVNLMSWCKYEPHVCGMWGGEPHVWCGIDPHVWSVCGYAPHVWVCVWGWV